MAPTPVEPGAPRMDGLDPHHDGAAEGLTLHLNDQPCMSPGWELRDNAAPPRWMPTRGVGDRPGGSGRRAAGGGPSRGVGPQLAAAW